MKRCAECNEPIVPGSEHYQELVHGWVLIRAKGANAVRLARYTQRFVHETCLLKADAGEQLELPLD
jgi:hypothetical protein